MSWQEWLFDAVIADPRNELMVRRSEGDGLVIRMTHRQKSPNIWHQEARYLPYLLADKDYMQHAVESQARALNQGIVQGGPYGPKIR